MIVTWSLPHTADPTEITYWLVLEPEQRHEQPSRGTKVAKSEVMYLKKTARQFTHSALLSGLKAESRYAYFITFDGTDTSIGTFWTAVEKERPTSFLVGVSQLIHLCGIGQSTPALHPSPAQRTHLHHLYLHRRCHIHNRSVYVNIPCGSGVSEGVCTCYQREAAGKTVGCCLETVSDSRTHPQVYADMSNEGSETTLEAVKEEVKWPETSTSEVLSCDPVQQSSLDSRCEYVLHSAGPSYDSSPCWRVDPIRSKTQSRRCPAGIILLCSTLVTWVSCQSLHGWSDTQHVSLLTVLCSTARVSNIAHALFLAPHCTPWGAPHPLRSLPCKAHCWALATHPHLPHCEASCPIRGRATLCTCPVRQQNAAAWLCPHVACSIWPAHVWRATRRHIHGNDPAGVIADSLHDDTRQPWKTAALQAVQAQVWHVVYPSDSVCFGDLMWMVAARGWVGVGLGGGWGKAKRGVIPVSSCPIWPVMGEGQCL